MFPYPFSFFSPSDTGLADINNAFSMEFDGIDQVVGLGPTAIVSGVFSVSMWVKRSAISGGDSYQSFFSKDDVSAQRTFNCYMQQSTGLLSFWTSANGLYDAAYRSSTSTVIHDTNWHYLVFINGGTGVNNRIYIDGTEASYIATGTGTSSLWVSIIDTYIGGHWATSGAHNYYQFLGNIDELGVFDYALTEPDITEIYDATGTGKTADLSDLSTPPIAWYRMGD